MILLLSVKLLMVPSNLNSLVGSLFGNFASNNLYGGQFTVRDFIVGDVFDNCLGDPSSFGWRFYAQWNHA